jgi:hypothetical protein
VFDHAKRRARLSERMRAEGIDLLFLGLSADLEYLTGIRRGVPFFGQSSYAHGWVTGAFFRADELPTYVLPRMVAAFDLEDDVEGERCGRAPRSSTSCVASRRGRNSTRWNARVAR